MSICNIISQAHIMTRDDHILSVFALHHLHKIPNDDNEDNDHDFHWLVWQKALSPKGTKMTATLINKSGNKSPSKNFQETIRKSLLPTREKTKDSKEDYSFIVKTFNWKRRMNLTTLKIYQILSNIFVPFYYDIMMFLWFFLMNIL